ncbi:hypothetical protein DRO58_08480, partial [Candidatus Bathyarchaeota archaeon]
MTEGKTLGWLSMYRRQLTIYTLIALLALTPLLAAIPTPVAAAVEKPEVSIDYPYLVIGEVNATRTITIVNPLDNPDIEEIRIILPEESADFVNCTEVSGFIGSPSVDVVGSWIVVLTADETYGYLLPDGGKGEVTLTIDPEDAETEEGVVDKYKVTVKIEFVTGETLTEKIYLYEGCATGVEVDVLYEGEPVSSSTAGEKITVTVQTVNATGYSTADEGVPLVIWGEYYDEDAEEWVQVEIAEVFTDSDGYAEATYTPTKAVDWTFRADVVMYGHDEEPDLKAKLTPGEAPLTVEPAEPTKVVVHTEYDVEGYDVTYLESQEVDVWVTLADDYDNPVTLKDSSATVTLTANRGELTDTEVSIPKGATESEHTTYKPDTVYGTYALITATVEVKSGVYEGTYTGSSKTLKTSTLADSFKVEVLPTSVPAGEYATITVQLKLGEEDFAQEGVPVTFEITEEDYGGHLSVTSTTTDEDGVATTKLYVDTELGAETTVEVTVAKPTTEDPTATLGTTETPKIKTIAGEPAALGIEAPEGLEPGESWDLRIYLADAYGNEVTDNMFGAAIKVTLKASAGTLEKNYTYIPADWPETGQVYIEYTAPDAYCVVTITASTTQYGLEPATVEILVTTLNPIVNITSPVVDTTVTTNETEATVYIAGWAKPSPAAEDVSIREIKYSLDGADNVTVPMTGTEVETGKVFFNFSVALTVNATHTITVYAVDSDGYEGSDTRVITVSYAPAAPVLPTEVSEASTDKASYSPGEEVK